VGSRLGVRDAFEREAPLDRVRRRTHLPFGTAPELASILGAADAGARQRLIGDLHVRAGNAAVARLVEHRAEASIQRFSLSSMLADVIGGVGELFEGDETETETGEEALPIPTRSGTQIVVADSPFTVTGTFAEVAEQMAARTEAASVASEVSDMYFFPTTDPIKLANITVTETVSLPTWRDRPSASDPEKREWDRFRAALSTHEDAHVAIDRTHFTDVHKKCIGVSHEKAEARIAAVEAAATLANDEFDDKTNHGKLTGTVIDAAAGSKGKTEKVP
jgi:hypothetical protein